MGDYLSFRPDSVSDQMKDMNNNQQHAKIKGYKILMFSHFFPNRINCEIFKYEIIQTLSRFIPCLLLEEVF